MAFLWDIFVRPAMFRMEAEPAHELGMRALRSGFAAPFYADANSFGIGPVKRFGLEFANPLGIAAGFDKNAVAVNQLASLGFGFVEIGTVTYRPQMGNPKPRMFRLPEDKALINRLGFNNEGAVAIAERLRNLRRTCVVGVNIGKNKDVPNEEATENYLGSFKLLQPMADYVAINISSPNTPNLRELQKSENLDELLGVLQDANWDRSRQRDGDPSVRLGPKPLLVKIAPDLSEGEIEAAVDICRKHDISGIIATNTTIGREGLRSPNVQSIGAGGLSGRPLTVRSTEVISAINKYSKGKLPIIGVGGVFDAQDAFNKIAAGASLVQAYTGFIYGGPSFAKDVNLGLAKILKARGFSNVDDAVGSGLK
jgi:dihydroorotate dehydrogenase